jgi:hypothetical protein
VRSRLEPNPVIAGPEGQLLRTQENGRCKGRTTLPRFAPDLEADRELKKPRSASPTPFATPSREPAPPRSSRPIDPAPHHNLPERLSPDLDRKRDITSKLLDSSVASNRRVNTAVYGGTRPVQTRGRPAQTHDQPDGGETEPKANT